MGALIFFPFIFLAMFSGSSAQMSKPSVFKLEENQEPVLTLETKNEANIREQRELNKQGSSLTQGKPGMLTLQGRPEYSNQQGRPEVLNQPSWMLLGKSEESKKNPDASKKQEGSGLYGQQGNTGSSSQPGKPGSSIQQGSLGSSSQPGKPALSSQQGKPELPNQQGKPGSSSQQVYLGSFSQQGNPGLSSQQGKPGSSYQQGKPGSSSQQVYLGSFSQQGKPGSPSQQGKPGSSSQQRNSRSFNKQGERKNGDNSLKSNIMEIQTSSKSPWRNTQCASIYKPVCGSDGRTYGNLCVLKEAKRLSKGRLNLRHEGKC